MADDELEKIPEEQWAAEMAEENYNPDEEDYGHQFKKKNNEKAPKEVKKEANQDIEPLVQQIGDGLQEVAENQTGFQFAENVQKENEVIVKLQVPPPPEPVAAQAINNRVLNELRDQFEEELEFLAENIPQPIDELEPGFPQYIHFRKQHLPKGAPEDQLAKQLLPEFAADDGQKVEPPPKLPLFPLLEQMPNKQKRIPLNMNPNEMRRAFDEMPEDRRQIYLRQLRNELFPDLVAAKQPEPLQNKQQKFQFDDFLQQPQIQEELEEFEEDPNIDILLKFNENHNKEERMREDLYIERRLKEEEEEYNEMLRREVYKKKKPKEGNDLSVLLNRGLQKHNETPEMKNIKKLLNGQSIEKPKAKPFYGSARIDYLNDDELRILFGKFTFQGQLILSLACTQWQGLLFSAFEKHTYLWFSNEEMHSKRFLPIEICCQTCRSQTDSEPVIRIVKNFYLPQVIDEILSLTKSLKCLRLHRFEFSRTLIIPKLQKSCPLLQHLDLTECYDFNIEVIKELGNYFPQIRHLLLSSTNLNEDMLKVLLTRIKYLETLDVSATMIDGSSLRLLSSGYLKRLDIRCCPNISRHHLLDAIKRAKLKDLQHLKMDAIASRDLYTEMNQRLDSLLLLEVSGFNGIVLKAYDFMAPIIMCRRLQSLKFGRNVVVNRVLVEELGRAIPDMRSFSIEFADFGERPLTDNDLANIARGWSLLERLEIINCPAAAKGFSEAICELKNLSFLNLTQCTRLTDEFFADTIKNGKSNTGYIVLDNCHNLGKGTLDACIIKAKRMTNEILRVSMLRTNLLNLPYLKSKLLPQNLQISYSSSNAQTYVTFDGQRIKRGRMTKLVEYLKDS